MKRKSLILIAGLLALAGSLQAQKKVVLTVDDVTFDANGLGEIVVNLNYPTQETVVGYNFKLMLPDGIKGINAKTGKQTASGKVTAASITLNNEIHPLLWNDDEEDFILDPKEALRVQEAKDGGVLIIWIDQNKKTPLVNTEGQLMTIKVMKDDNFESGNAMLYDICLTNDKSESLDLNNIADVPFSLGTSGGSVVQEKKVVISAGNVEFAADGTGEIVVNYNYPTNEAVVGYDFSIALPEGVKGANARTGNATGSGKITTASITLNNDIHPLLWNGVEETFSQDPKNALQVKVKDDGNILIIWIDDDNKLPLLKSEGQLMTIKVVKDTTFTSGEGTIYDVNLSNDKNVSLDLGNIADVTFSLVSGTSPGTTPFEPPTNLTVTSSYLLDWLDDVNASYKPIVTVTSEGSSYGHLTVEGDSTLSMEKFNINYYAAAGRQAYASLINNATMRADNVSVDLQIGANRWEFVTFPFDVKVGELRLSRSDLPFAIRQYDGQKRADGLTNETWVDVSAESTLEAGKGYILRIPAIFGNTATFGFDALQTVNKNNIFANDNVEAPLAEYLSEFGHNRSWNLIGNPYPSYFDIRAMQTSAPIIVWNSTANSYEAYSPADDAYILTPGQAFFVQRPVDEQSITFLKAGRQHNLTVRNISYASDARSDVNADRSVFNLVLAANGQSDRTRFVINAKATIGYEMARDAAKFQSLMPTAVQLYTLEGGVRYSINERPLDNGIVNLGMEIAEAGLYTITLDTKADQEVTIVDNMNGLAVRLDGNADGYAFTSEAGTFNSRFSIVLGGGEVTGITVLENESVKSDIYDMQGRRVNSTQKGVYVVNGKKTIVK